LEDITYNAVLWAEDTACDTVHWMETITFNNVLSTYESTFNKLHFGLGGEDYLELCALDVGEYL
jgi:hypothetical protein